MADTVKAPVELGTRGQTNTEVVAGLEVRLRQLSGLSLGLGLGVVTREPGDLAIGIAHGNEVVAIPLQRRVRAGLQLL
ncbi:hypothetical protein D3C81_860500 [compost metagenome]